MPKALHDKLAKQALAQGLKGDKKDAYVYGTLNKVENAHKKKHASMTSKALRGGKG